MTSIERPRTSRRRRTPSWANIASTTALVLALGSATAVAVPQVGSAGILNGSVASIDLKNLDVRAIDLAAQSVTTAKLKSLSVTAPKLATGAVTAPKLAAEAVTADKLATVPAATAQRTVNQTVTQSFVGVEVGLNDERLDTGAIHAVNTGNFTAPAAGTYMLVGHVTWNQFIGGKYAYVSIRDQANIEVGSCPVSNLDVTHADASGGTVDVSCMRRLTAGQSMQVRAAQVDVASASIDSALASFWRIGR